MCCIIIIVVKRGRVVYMLITTENTLTEGYKEGLVAIWWYTDDGIFWEFSKNLDDAEDDHGYLQYSLTKNHMNLWKAALEKFVTDVHERDSIYHKGYKSVERGRVIFNLRTQCYEVICSNKLVNDTTFRTNCIKQFNLTGNRVDFVALPHYAKIELTGNPAVDNLYYD